MSFLQLARVRVYLHFRINPLLEHADFSSLAYVSSLVHIQDNPILKSIGLSSLSEPITYYFCTRHSELLTELVLSELAEGHFYIHDCDGLTSISAPKLTHVVGDIWIVRFDNTAVDTSLETVDFSSLVSIGHEIVMWYHAELLSIDYYSLEVVVAGMILHSNAKLTQIAAPQLTYNGAKVELHTNAALPYPGAHANNHWQPLGHWS
jgi:hypothetical protein